LSLHSTEAPHGIDLSRPLFTCTNANQAARPRVSPHHGVITHHSQESPSTGPRTLRSSPCHQFLLELDEAPCPARFDTFLNGSSEFVIFSGLVPGLLGVMFSSLHDLYRASRSCHKVLDELIPEVLLSTLKPCINTKLQNRHALMNLLYQGG
jgi:hypothetical protein